MNILRALCRRISNAIFYAIIYVARFSTKI